METERIALPQVLALRSDSNSPSTVDPKDGFLRNCYREQTPIGEMIVKRPGLEINTLLPSGCAQGSFVYEGTPYFIIGQTIYALPDENTTGSGGGGGGGGTPDGSDWELISTVAINTGTPGALTSFNGDLYFIGSFGSARVFKSTDDGVTWTQLATPFSTRTFPQSLTVFNGLLYAVGIDTGTLRVWSSPDGITWTITTSGLSTNDTFLGASSNSTYIFALFGTHNNSVNTFTLRIWRSSDGINWTLINANIPNLTVPPRYGSSSLVIAGEILYVIGGEESGGPSYTSDVWQSSDSGVTWTLLSTGGFPARRFPFVWSAGGKLFLAGGYDGATKSDVYSSSNGIAWTLLTSSALWGPYQAGTTGGGYCVHDNRLYLTKKVTGAFEVYRTTGNSTSYPIPF